MVELPETCRKTNVSILVTDTFGKIVAEIRHVASAQEDEYWSQQCHLFHGFLWMGTVCHRYCRARKW